ncbi:MAG: hypothetical protein ABSC26_04985 [Stellaceae bacterium]|jgi:hypothetical protein
MTLRTVFTVTLALLCVAICLVAANAASLLDAATSASASAQIAANNTTQLLSRVASAPLDAFDGFAELAAAIAVAYAGLDSFRYRASVKRYVREKIREKFGGRLLGYVQSGTVNRNNEDWAILYMLGKLEELGFLGPDRERKIKPARHFLVGKSFRKYNWRYASNLDKSTAIAIGAIAASIIWFGMLDRIYFPDPVIDAPGRAPFLTCIGYFYIITFVVGFAFIGLFRSLWEWEMDHAKSEYRIIHFTQYIVGGLFFIFAAICSIKIFSIHIAESIHVFHERYPLGVLALSTLLCVLGPIYLIFMGRSLTKVMTDEVDECIECIAGEIANAPAKVPTPAPVPR